MRSKKNIKENLLRSMIRNEVQKILRENDDETRDKEAPADTETSKEKEPEDDRNNVIEKISFGYVKSLKNNLQQVSADELAEALNFVMGHFGLSKDSKMQILRSLKDKIHF